MFDRIWVSAELIEKKSKKNSIADFIEKKSKKIPLLISLKKNQKKFPLWSHCKQIDPPTADFIEKNSKKNSAADFIAKIFGDILLYISRRKKKGQILSKFGRSVFSAPYKFFRIMVGETLKKIYKSYRI